MNLIIVVISAILIWFSGTRLAIYADWIAHRFNLGRAFIGVLLLAFVTSSPELATTITASWIGNAPLAINNLLGGINLQTTIIAVADFCFVIGALTYFSPKSSLLIGGLFVILQSAIALVAFTYGEFFTLWNVGFWPFLLFLVYLLMLYSIYSHEKSKKWVPAVTHEQTIKKYPAPEKKNYSNFRLFSLFALNALIVFITGCLTTYFADKLAIDWNWSGSWMGASLLALVTSLPEISTTLGAFRQKAYVLGIANIFGSNVLTIALLFPADLFFRNGPIIKEGNPSNLFLLGVSIIITSIFLWGILERRNKTIFRMGFDSFSVLIVYFLSLICLYFLTN